MSFTTALPALELGLAFFADECSEYSVTAVSIVRLTYLIESLSPDFSFFDSASIYIWTSVEANVSSIPCGQYMVAFSVRSCLERRSANITSFYRHLRISRSLTPLNISVMTQPPQTSHTVHQMPQSSPESPYMRPSPQSRSTAAPS